MKEILRLLYYHTSIVVSYVTCQKQRLHDHEERNLSLAEEDSLTYITYIRSFRFMSGFF
jgi:hypothetical protein